MTQEDKELLLVDLCARFPYGVKIQYDSQACKLVAVNDDYTVLLLGEDGHKPNIEDDLFLDIEKAKPYLRSMSSMTEEEEEQWEGFMMPTSYFDYENNGLKAAVFWDELSNAIDWLNAHHFDYRGLIEKGLALVAPEGMYGKGEQQ